MHWNRWLQKLHIYAGLYATPFMILMGLSALFFNHEALLNPDKVAKSREWSAQMNLPKSLSNEVTWDTVKTQLNIYGYVPFWLHYKDEQGDYHFEVHRPGRRYYITIQYDKQNILVVEQVKTFRQIIGAMHPLIVGGLDKPVLKFWKIYGQSAAVTALIALLLSVYFWAGRSWKKRSNRLWIIGGFAFSVLLILSIWLY